MIEHRFAFFYWIKIKQELLSDRRPRNRQKDEEFTPPDLISWDWHDDYDGESGYIESELRRLNQQNEQEVALFCWAGLQPVNNGQIGPAVWLNAVGNVYIVLKQDTELTAGESQVQKDRYGKPHHIFYMRSPRQLPNVFFDTNSKSGVIWDIDLDFFTESKPVDDQKYTPVLSKRAIKSLLSPRSEWMQLILGNLKGITVALEPEYTGGLSQSLEIFRQWEAAFFESPLFSNECRWKADLFG